MRTPSDESTLDQALQVCTSCKARKRKCDKVVPTCTPCSRRNLKCRYLSPEQIRKSTSVADSSWAGLTLDDDPSTDVQSIDYPTMLFLDPALLQYGHVELIRAISPVPVHVLELLGDMDDIRATTAKFFEHIHTWMPFVSKKRFYEIYLQSSFQSRPDVVLLLLCLKLITTWPPKNPRNPRTALYHAAKHYYLEVEGSSIFSTLVLQSGVLIALYELGHAIYPAAYLTIGACARYAQALGINTKGQLNTRKVLTLVEVEERRRVWWAIVILDRYVNIGCPGRPLATADPTLDDLLPADDASWDQGIVKYDTFTLASPMNDHMSKFALLCQAARLLGQVLQNVSRHSTNEDTVWKQLDRTLRSMLTASLNVELPDHDQINLIYSSLIALYTPWLNSDGVCILDVERSQQAKVIFQQTTENINSNLVEQRCLLGRNPENLSPWGLFFAYQICAAYLRSNGEDLCSHELIENLRNTFSVVDTRWNAAGVYLQLLEAQEVINKT